VSINRLPKSTRTQIDTRLSCAVYQRTLNQESTTRLKNFASGSSVRNEGKTPVTPDMILQKVIRPALVRAKITGKVIGWHSFRHSLATNLRASGADLKTAQELLRHANSRITLEVTDQSK
jgi:site-specific recombinase XerD